MGQIITIKYDQICLEITCHKAIVPVRRWTDAVGCGLLRILATTMFDPTSQRFPTPGGLILANRRRCLRLTCGFSVSGADLGAPGTRTWQRVSVNFFLLHVTPTPRCGGNRAHSPYPQGERVQSHTVPLMHEVWPRVWVLRCDTHTPGYFCPLAARPVAAFRSSGPIRAWVLLYQVTRHWNLFTSPYMWLSEHQPCDGAFLN